MFYVTHPSAEIGTLKSVDNWHIRRFKDKIINPGGGDIFRTRPDRPSGPPSLLHNEYRVSFPVGKRQGRGVNHPPLSSSEVQEKVELYLYSPCGPSWLVTG